MNNKIKSNKSIGRGLSVFGPGMESRKSKPRTRLAYLVPGLNSSASVMRNQRQTEVILELSTVGALHQREINQIRESYVQPHISQINENKLQALRKSIEDGCESNVKDLLKRGMDINVIIKPEGVTPMHWAIWNDKFNIVKLLLTYRIESVGKDLAGCTPLHYAIYCDRARIFNALIQLGFDVNAQDKNGLTPLHYAARNNLTWALNALIEKGAMVNAQDFGGSTPLDYALIHKAEATADILINKNSELQKFYEQQLLNYQNTEQSLINFPLLENQTQVLPTTESDETGNLQTTFDGNAALQDSGDITIESTSLHDAVKGDDIECIAKLIQQNIDLNVKDSMGWTPLMYAAFFSKPYIMGLLLTYGADVNILSNSGKTALDFAEDAECICLLAYATKLGK